jgi:hypothetical protein
MTKREKELVALFAIDRAYCSRVRQGYNDAVVATESKAKYKFCTECGLQFEFKHPAEKFCGAARHMAPDKRRYRGR